MTMKSRSVSPLSGLVRGARGEGRTSEFHGANAFGAETHGYRVTTLSRDYRIRVVCCCPAAEWGALQPVFDNVIDSLGIGTAQL
jgi:hypothetical protein